MASYWSDEKIVDILASKKNAIAKKTISPGTILTRNLFEYKRTKVKKESDVEKSAKN